MNSKALSEPLNPITGGSLGTRSSCHGGANPRVPASRSFRAYGTRVSGEPPRPGRPRRSTDARHTRRSKVSSDSTTGPRGTAARALSAFPRSLPSSAVWQPDRSPHAGNDLPERKSAHFRVPRPLSPPPRKPSGRRTSLRRAPHSRAAATVRSPGRPGPGLRPAPGPSRPGHAPPPRPRSGSLASRAPSPQPGPRLHHTPRSPQASARWYLLPFQL